MLEIVALTVKTDNSMPEFARWFKQVVSEFARWFKQVVSEFARWFKQVVSEFAIIVGD